jgi:hypothetical protein
LKWITHFFATAYHGVMALRRLYIKAPWRYDALALASLLKSGAFAALNEGSDPQATAARLATYCTVELWRHGAERHGVFISKRLDATTP